MFTVKSPSSYILSRIAQQALNNPCLHNVGHIAPRYHIIPAVTRLFMQRIRRGIKSHPFSSLPSRPILKQSLEDKKYGQNILTSTRNYEYYKPSSFFSTQTISHATNKNTPLSSRSRVKKDPIIVTPKAAERIKFLLSSNNAKNAIGIRLGVKRRGCNGLSYTLNYAFEKQPNEEEMEAHGVKVFIEPMALFNVVGTVMDFETTDLSQEFTFQNPNSKGECGCGESFNV